MASLLTEEAVHERIYSLRSEVCNNEAQIKELKNQIMATKEIEMYYLQGCWITYSMENRWYLVRVAEIRRVVKMVENPFGAEPIEKLIVDGTACFYMETMLNCVTKLSNNEYFSVPSEIINLLTTEKAFDIIDKEKERFPDVDLVFARSLSQVVEYWNGERN